ncbi:quinone oxidoreductase, partial [Enterobacter hormaechei]
ASRILSRDEFAETRPLEKQVWAGAVDTVGDKVLAKVLAQMNYGGCVAACGLAGGFALPTTVMPFILRNVRLQGVDSVMTPAERRAEAWERLVQDLPASFFDQSATEITLSQAPEFASKIMDNQFHGRALVKIA